MLLEKLEDEVDGWEQHSASASTCSSASASGHVVNLKFERGDTRGFERTSFEIEGQVSKAGSCRVELVTLSCVARSLSRSSELGGRDACRLTESGAKIIAGPNTMFGCQLEGWGPPAMFRGPEEGGTCSCKQRGTRRQGPSPS